MRFEILWGGVQQLSPAVRDVHTIHTLSVGIQPPGAQPSGSAPRPAALGSDVCCRDRPVATGGGARRYFDIVRRDGPDGGLIPKREDRVLQVAFQ